MALVFDKSSEDQGVWREYPHYGVSVCVRPITKKTWRKLRKDASTQHAEFVGGRRVMREETDEEKFDQLLYRHIVADWDGIVDPEKTKIPPTDEAVDEVFSTFASLADEVLKDALALAEDEAQRKAEALGNSKASRGGKGSGPKASEAAGPAER